MDDPILWFLNRGSGFVVLALLTLSVVLGVLARRGNAGSGLPRFVTQSMHRNLSLLSVALLAVHVLSAVVDEFVDIRWWHALVPFQGDYEPVWLGLGTLASDLVVAVVVTSVLRHRMPLRGWRAAHLSVYLAWVASVVHGLAIGSDTGETWATATYAGCVALFALAVLVRLADVARHRAHTRPGAAPAPSPPPRRRAGVRR